MIYASVRKGFESTTFLGPLQFCDTGGRELQWTDLANLLACRKVDILIHGYKNSFLGADKAYRKIDQNLEDYGIHGERIGFFWPGSWAALGFSIAEVRANKSGVLLAELIDFLSTVCKATVTIETHSLGARVALTALKNLKSDPVSRVILTAPAVDADCFLPGKEFAGIGSKVKDAPIQVLHSVNDSVLKVAYPPANWFFKRAAGLKGADYQDKNLVYPAAAWAFDNTDLSGVIKAHGDYKDCPYVYASNFWR